MGTVFLGRDQRLNRPVAIKTLRQEIATAVAVQRFIQEAQHLARLNHPNVVRVHARRGRPTPAEPAAPSFRGVAGRAQVWLREGGQSRGALVAC
jgi:hypothetical protein